jgi:hypothetical protein
LIIVQNQQEKESWMSYVFSAYGSLLSGLGTIGLLILAIYQLPFEFEKFRMQQAEQARLERERLSNEAATERSIRLSEKIELVAAETLESVYRLINAINHISNPFSFSGEGDTKELEEQKSQAFNKGKVNADIFTKMYNSRLETTMEDIQLFYKMKTKAKVFLNKEVNQVINDIDSAYKGIRVSAIMHSHGLEAGPDRKGVSAYEEAFHDFFDTHKKRSTLLEQKKLELEEMLKVYIHPN